MNDTRADDPFEQAKAHFLAGLEAHRAGDDALAEQRYLASLALVPGRASTLTNLAATQLRLGRPHDALRQATAALAVTADDMDALLQTGTALAQLGRTDEALIVFDRMLAHDGDHRQAWSRRGSLLREMQRYDEAAHAFRNALRLGADEALHRYYLAAVDASETPRTAPVAYVQGLFDAYAGDFEQHLVDQLRYCAPQRLIDGLATAPHSALTRALDLGCGTGLCAPWLRPLVRQLTGIDLSERMLDIARGLNLYDHLEQAELTDYLARTDVRFDLVVAADVLIYLGDLAPLFNGVRRVMDHGVFCFTVETEVASNAQPDAQALATQGPVADYRLLPSLRYAHSEAYLRRLAALHGFGVIAMQAGPVREEQTRTVDGLYVYLGV